MPGDGGWLRQFGHVEDLADAMAAMLGVPAAFGRAYNVSGEEAITQVGFVELIAEVMKRPLTLRHFDPALLKAGDKPGPSSARTSSTTATPCTRPASVRAELGIRPRYTLAAGLPQTFEWYQGEGLDRPRDRLHGRGRLLRALGPSSAP